MPTAERTKTGLVEDDATTRPTDTGRPNPEVVVKATRRRFTAKYKQQILAKADAASEPGAVGALLRREGLYSSHLVKWRRDRDASVLHGLEPQKRGPKSKRTPLSDENHKLQRENERLIEQLRRAELIIEVQKKSPRCWEHRSRRWIRKDSTDGRSQRNRSDGGNPRGVRCTRYCSLLVLSQSASRCARGGSFRFTSCVELGRTRNGAGSSARRTVLGPLSGGCTGNLP